MSAAPETIIGGGWIVEAVEQSASFSQIRDGDILVQVNDKACIKYRYQCTQDLFSARSLANITLEFFRPAEIGANTSVNHTPSWMPPANPSTTMAPSMTPILKPSPLTQTPTLSPAYTQTVQIMKCSLGNNYLYGSNSERLSLLEITEKIQGFPLMMCALTSLSLCYFFYYLRSLFYSTLKIFMALQKIQLQLYYQQS